MIPAGGADADSVGALVSPLTPYFSDHVGLDLTDGLTEEKVHVDVVAVTFTPDYEVVNVGESQTKMEMSSRTGITVISDLET